MADKTFTFIKLATGGKLITRAKSEKEARERHHLDPELWQLEGKAETEKNPPSTEPEIEPIPD